MDEGGGPRFTDALYGIMAIYEIQGKYDLAVQTCDRILLNLREEWGMKDEQAVLEALEERERLAKKICPPEHDPSLHNAAEGFLYNAKRMLPLLLLFALLC